MDEINLNTFIEAEEYFNKHNKLLSKLEDIVQELDNYKNISECYLLGDVSSFAIKSLRKVYKKLFTQIGSKMNDLEYFAPYIEVFRDENGFVIGFEDNR